MGCSAGSGAGTRPGWGAARGTGSSLQHNSPPQNPRRCQGGCWLLWGHRSHRGAHVAPSHPPHPPPSCKHLGPWALAPGPAQPPAVLGTEGQGLTPRPWQRDTGRCPLERGSASCPLALKPSRPLVPATTGHWESQRQPGPFANLSHGGDLHVPPPATSLPPPAAPVQPLPGQSQRSPLLEGGSPVKPSPHGRGGGGGGSVCEVSTFHTLQPFTVASGWDPPESLGGLGAGGCVSLLSMEV